MTNSAVLPKYYRVKEQIKNLIEVWKERDGEPIPSERELITRFGVSRITVRRAIDELVQEGYLFRVQGKGTYIEMDHENQNLINLTSCTSEIKALGMVPSRKVLESVIVPCSVKQAHDLKINSSDRLFFLDRIYFADDIAVNRTQTYLPYSLLPDIETYDFARYSLYETLENQFGIKLTRAHRTIEAVSAEAEIAESLSIKENTPVLHFNCLTYGIAGGVEVPIEQFSCYYRSDKFKFFINQIH